MAPNDPFQHSERDSGPPSAGLTLNLSSNNPFRNRAASPASLIPGLASPPSPFDDPPSRPTSRNPFIDQPPPPLRSPGVMSNNSDSKSLSAEDIFDSLTLDDSKPALRPQQRPMDGKPKPAPRQGENMPPPYSSVNQHPTQSQEEAMRARKIQAGSARPGPSTSPQRKMQRRPRRNSESSVMGFDAKSLTEEEKKIIAKHRERDRVRRELRDRDAKDAARDAKEPRDGKEPREGREGRDGKERKKSSRPTRPSRRMDIIDQLDATSIYGTGLFHHDGPFDALNPHRNRNTSRRAPMQAFPKDSLNNSIGGSGPLNKAPDHAQFMGRGETEAFRDFAGSKKNKNGYTASGEPIFDPVARSDLIHGDESYGLGTSTFLEGTPAARTAIARREAEQAQDVEGGLQRKKSLAQRIRHINKGPRGDFGPSGRLTNPEGAYTTRSPESMPTGGSGGEGNPFFSEFSKGEESISVRPRDGALSPNSPPPVPRRGSNGGPLERRATTDATMSNEDAPAKPSGFLGRMKSLKGGRKPRNASNADVESGGSGQYPIPGTAV